MLSITAQRLLAAYDQVELLDRGECEPIDSLEQAIAIQDIIVASRVARGEVRVGYKIGFTNRTIWDRYGVHHPIWGPVYDSTLHLLDKPVAQAIESGYVQPRLEPEIVVRLARIPEQATVQAIAQSLDWVAHGFEIVQSHYPDWQFSGAESFAAQGLHGALFVGPRYKPKQLCINPTDLPTWLSELEVDLYEAGQSDAIDRGIGAYVLDGPLHAIAHLMAQLQSNGRTLSAGDIITTGTITDAQPLIAGQQWRTRLSNAGPLAGMRIDVKR
ncbi:MAG: fumarylacetoacetate hydrolase family protein [Burkholderiaceae bacterium]